MFVSPQTAATSLFVFISDNSLIFTCYVIFEFQMLTVTEHIKDLIEIKLTFHRKM